MRTFLTVFLSVLLSSMPVFAGPESWRAEWPNTDFSRHDVDFSEIRSGGPPKDGIPAIDRPTFAAVSEVTGLSETEPVVGLIIDGEARAYPLRVLMWHEIVNDTVAGVPVAVTFCPLCNSALVFDRRLDGRLLDFGTTGKLRNSDLVMYDRQTESWWQQYLGEAIVGALTGSALTEVPARLESLASFKARAMDGARLLLPPMPERRNYGRNPYVGYDRLPRPFLYAGDMPEGIEPLARVLDLDGTRAWSLTYLRKAGEVIAGDLVIRWTAGQNSALDTGDIAQGRDVGNVTVQRKTAAGLEDVPYHLPFAFAFHAFHPEAPIITR